jgi:hypothetical protein
MLARTAYWYARLLHRRNATDDRRRALALIDEALLTTERLGMKRLEQDLRELRGQVS